MGRRHHRQIPHPIVSEDNSGNRPEAVTVSGTCNVWFGSAKRTYTQGGANFRTDPMRSFWCIRFKGGNGRIPDFRFNTHEWLRCALTTDVEANLAVSRKRTLATTSRFPLLDLWTSRKSKVTGLTSKRAAGPLKHVVRPY